MKTNPSKVVIIPHPPVSGSQTPASTPKSNSQEQEAPKEENEKKENGPEETPSPIAKK